MRHLPGLFLIESKRNGSITRPVAPDKVIQANDRMVFAGVVSTTVDLEKIPGLVPADVGMRSPQRTNGLNSSASQSLAQVRHSLVR